MNDEEILTPVARLVLLWLAANPSAGFTKRELSRALRRRVSLVQVLPLYRAKLVSREGSAYRITAHGLEIARKVQ